MNETVRDQAQSLRELMDKKTRETKVITVASGKGGVGKSSICVNLAIALAALGVRVLVIDADFGLANVDVMLGVNSRYNISHLLKGQKNLKELVQEGHNGVQFISGGSGIYDLLQLEEDQLSGIMENLMQMPNPADITLFDMGAGINENILQLVLASSETIVVTTPEPTAILDAYALIKSINKRESAHTIRMIMNKCENKREAENAIIGFQKVIRKHLGIEVDSLGYVLYDRDVSKSIKLQTPIMVSHPNGTAASNINIVAKTLLNLPAPQGPASKLSKLFFRWLG